MMIALLKACNIPIEVHVDLASAMKLARGRANPLTAIIGITRDGSELRDVFDTVYWIDERGLRPL